MKTYKKITIAVLVLIVLGIVGMAMAAYTTHTAIADVSITSHDNNDIVFARGQFALTCSTSTDTDCEVGVGTVSDPITHTWSGPGTFDPETGTSTTWTAPGIPGEVTITVTASDNNSPVYANDTDKTDSVKLLIVGGGDIYGMEVVSAVESPNDTVTVTTTGAKYVLTTTGMEMFRRIDPNTNTVNERKVAELDFDSSISNLSVELNDPNIAIVHSNKLSFYFFGDSLFFVVAKDTFSFKHENLIADAPWNAPLDPNDRGLDRMWTDGYGGSLHAAISGASATSTSTNSTSISMSAKDVTSHMVFPPKTFDFEGLYGTNAKPFVHFLYTTSEMDKFINDTGSYRQNLIDDGFGVIVLWNHIYDRESDKWKPVQLDSDPNILGYQIANPNDINDFISTAHNNNFKCITYLRYPASEDWNSQDIAITLNWMRNFQSQHNFDGWYFDNADTGELLEDYEFMRQVRTDIGNGGIIYHHNSKDVWEGRSGPRERRAIMVDSYTNYTLCGESGEHAKINDLNEPYIRYFSVGYGISQTYSAYKRKGDMKIAISEEEKRRLLGQNLNGCERNRNDSWTSYFKPAYNIRKAEYADANTFDPDVDWPLDGSSSDPNLNWFRLPTSVDANVISSSSVIITWSTDANSDSEVTYTDDGYWWYYKDSGGGEHDADGTVSDSNMVTSHSITLTGLSSSTPYEFKIRSNNGDANIPGEIIWGYVGDFNTTP